MPDDQNTTQNPISTENSIPPSPQEPTIDASIPNTASAPLDIAPKAPEAPKDVVTPPLVKDDNLAQSEIESQIVEPVQTASTDVEALADRQIEPKPEQTQAPETIPEIPTAQMGGNEPLSKPVEPIVSEPVPNPVVVVTQQPKNSIRELFAKAREAIQFRKRKKLDRIMILFAKQTKVTNDEVEKFLHVSDAITARYLGILVKENKIKQSGKTGKGVTYTKI